MSNQFAQWTTAEDQVVRTMYAMHGASVTAKALPGRTLGAVYRRATLLGFKRVFAGKPPRNAHNKRRPLECPASIAGPLPSVEEWLAAGNTIERPGPRPFLRIRPSARRPANPVRCVA